MTDDPIREGGQVLMAPKTLRPHMGAKPANEAIQLRNDCDVAADVVVALLESKRIRVPNSMALRELISELHIPIKAMRGAFNRRELRMRLALAGTDVEDTHTIGVVLSEQPEGDADGRP